MSYEINSSDNNRVNVEDDYVNEKEEQSKEQHLSELSAYAERKLEIKEKYYQKKLEILNRQTDIMSKQLDILNRLADKYL